MKRTFLHLFTVFALFLRDAETGEVRTDVTTIKGRFAPLAWLLKRLGLCPALAETHVWSVTPRLLQDKAWRKSVLRPTLNAMLDDKHCVLHLNNQTNWVAIHHPGWTLGTAKGMEKLFIPNPAMSFAVSEKTYKRMSAALLSDSRYWLDDTKLKRLSIVRMTEEKLMAIYRQKYASYSNAEERARQDVNRFRSDYDGVAATINKRAAWAITHETWLAGQTFETWRLFLEGDCVNKGDALYVPWQEEDIIIYEWNCTREILPTFTMLRITQADAVQQRVRTDWQSLVFFAGLRKWYPLVVKKRYQEIFQACENFTTLVKTLEESKIEALGPDYDEALFEDEEYLDEVRNLVQALPLLGEDFALAFKGCASKIVRLMGGGNSQRRKIERFSCPYPKGWAFRASVKPDISGLDAHGVMHYEKCVLKKGEVYCPQLNNGEEIFAFRWPIGSRKSHIWATNKVRGMYAKLRLAPSTVFVNHHDDKSFMKDLDGADKDDHITGIRHPKMLVDIREKLAEPHPLEDTPPNMEFLLKNSHPVNLPDVPLSWTEILKARRQKFLTGNVVTVGFYAYMQARFMVFGEHMNLFEEGLAGKKFFPLPWYAGEEAENPWPHQRMRHIPLEGFGSEPFMVSYYDYRTGLWNKIPLQDLVEFFATNMENIRVLGLSNKDDIKDENGDPIIYSEVLIDLANMKGDKYFKDGKPCPDVLRIQEKILGVFIEGLPGPKGSWSSGGCKTYLPLIDDVLEGRAGNANIWYEGKWSKPQQRLEGRSVPHLPKQWFPGEFQDGEFVAVTKAPRDIAADLLPEGYHFIKSVRGNSSSLIKKQVKQMMAMKEKDQLSSVFRGIIALSIEDNQRYYEQPLVYRWDKNNRYHYLSLYKEWLSEKFNDPEIVDREFAYTEGALSIARRFEAEILNQLWHQWQEHGGNKPTLTKKANKQDRTRAAKLMYDRWLSGLATVYYGIKDRDTGQVKESATLLELLTKKYGDPERFAKDPMSAPFAHLIDWSDAVALTEEFLGHFAKWAKTGLKLM